MNKILLLLNLFPIILFGQNGNLHPSSNQLYVIPVVFHVLHAYGPENISDVQILDALRILNEDFRMANADTVDIIPLFKPIAADCEIEFRLATLDPNGNCTDGIERIVTSRTYHANDAAKIHAWPNNKYLNIWIANSLENVAAVGYTHFPGGPDSTDGIMMRYDYIGSIGPSDYVRARMLTQIMGNYFNLYRTSSSTACGDDFVNDTPETSGSSTCNLSLSVCNPPIIENVQNFMDNSGCTRMFTMGQKSRMHNTLNSTVSGRNNLWTPANLTATGTDVPSANPCAPIADFRSSQYGCVLDTISFIDQSWNSNVSSWSWSFPGGIPATSIDSNPIVTYSAPGVYDATLIASNSFGTNTITKTSFVHITGFALNTMPFSEDFESPTSLPGNDGWIESYFNDSMLIRTDSANTTIGGIWSMMFNNFDNQEGEKESWITPSIDFSNIIFPIYLNFSVAHAQRTSSSDDELRLFYSTDCGKTWTATSYSKSGFVLSTAPITSSFFVPNSTQWRNETVTCNAVQQQSNVRFKFTNISDQGNNIFVDDFFITGSYVGIDELSQQYNINVYPNPSNHSAVLSFELPNRAKVSCTVKDILGKHIVTLINMDLQAGKHETKLPVLPPGIYMVETNINNIHRVCRMVAN